MTKLCLIALLFCTLSTSIAQPDSEPADTLFSRSEAIPKHRKILYHQLLDGNVEMARKTYRYLDSLTTDLYCPFFLYEDLAILHLTGDFGEVSERAKRFDEKQFEAYGKKIKLYPDSLSEVVTASLNGQRKTLEESIMHSVNDPEMADFLVLNLAMFQTNETTKHLNELSSQFQAKHPASPHRYYVRHFIRKVWKRSVAVGCGFNWGSNRLTKDLGNTFTPFTSFGMHLNLAIRRIELQLMGSVGGGYTKKNLIYSSFTYGKLPENTQYNYSEAKALISYLLVQNKLLRIKPLVGGAIMQIMPIKELAYSEMFKVREASLLSTSALCFGAEIDFNVLSYRNDDSPRRFTNRGLFLGLQYLYSSPRFSHPYISADGGIHSITLKLGSLFEVYRQVF